MHKLTFAMGQKRTFALQKVMSPYPRHSEIESVQSSKHDLKTIQLCPLYPKSGHVRCN